MNPFGFGERAFPVKTEISLGRFETTEIGQMELSDWLIDIVGGAANKKRGQPIDFEDENKTANHIDE